MTKQLSPLEAFEKIAKFTIETGLDDDNTHEVELRHHKSLWRRFRIVETALKDYEEMTNEDIEKPPYITFEEIQKIQAFYILKRTKIDIDWFVSSFIKQDAEYNVFLMLLEEMGNEGHLAKQLMMSEEEFDLLKEELK